MRPATLLLLSFHLKPTTQIHFAASARTSRTEFCFSGWSTLSRIQHSCLPGCSRLSRVNPTGAATTEHKAELSAALWFFGGWLLQASQRCCSFKSCVQRACHIITCACRGMPPEGIAPEILSGHGLLWTYLMSSPLQHNLPPLLPRKQCLTGKSELPQLIAVMLTAQARDFPAAQPCM